MEKGKVWARPPECWEWYLPFKGAFVAHWGMREEWELTDVEIDAWLLHRALARVAVGQDPPASCEG